MPVGRLKILSFPSLSGQTGFVVVVVCDASTSRAPRTAGVKGGGNEGIVRDVRILFVCLFKGLKAMKMRQHLLQLYSKARVEKELK